MDCDPGPVVVNPPAGRGRGDRLSRLDDGVLGHILSFLPSPEAARTALLSRRWRHVLPAVHSLSFDESERPVPTWEDYSDSWSPSGWGQPEVDPAYVPSQPFVNRVSAAIHGRHRGAQAAAPLRALRVAFREWEDGDARSATAVDGWLAYAAHQAAGDDGELHVDLRFGDEPLCHRAYALRRDGEEAPHVYLTGRAAMLHAYAVPSYLLRCAALRSLRVGPCRLDPPATVSLPSLHTLQLIRVIDGDDAVKLLLSGCPRLADLTLEACNNVTKLSVRRGTRLRRLALRCCHGLATVAADVSELRAFEYRGPVPPPTFRRATKPKHRPSEITSCEIDFCGEEASHPENVASLRDLFHLLSGATHLQLKSARLGAVFSTSPALPVFATLRELELTGILTDDDTAIIGTITRVLEHTPSLEILSLFFMPEPRPEKRRTAGCRKLEKLNEHWLKYDRYAAVDVPEEIPRCLRKRTKEINLVHYQGLLAQRMLAKFLLHKAPIVHEVCCEFAKGPLIMQTQLMEEIRGWVTNKSANIMFF